MPLLLGVFLTWSVAAEPRADSPATPEAQVFVFCAEPRPVLVRLEARLDGKPLETAWDEFIGQVIQALDGNKDGVLNPEELERMPPVRMILDPEFFGDFSPVGLGTVDTNPADGQVTRQELLEHFRRSGAGAFQVQLAQDRLRNFPFDPEGTANKAAIAEALNEALFKLLDANKDGKLAKEELTAAVDVLIKHDGDEDEMLTPRELLPNYNQLAGRDRSAPRPAPGGPPADNSPVLMVAPGESAARLGRRIVARYAPKGKKPADSTLGRKDIGLDETAFGQLDADGNGELDIDELARFIRRSADLALTARLGKIAEGETALDLSALGGRPAPLAGSARRPAEGTVVLDLGAARLDFRTKGEPASSMTPYRARDIYRDQFNVADKDGNGHLDAAEAKESRFFRNSFKVMDRDGDGKLHEKEVFAFLDWVGELQTRAQESCVTLTVLDQGRGLFDLIDGDRDGRLGVREVRNAFRLVEQLDRDGDGQIASGDVPRSYGLTLSRGPSDVNRTRNFAALARYAMEPPPSGPSAGPVWFRKMDRNRDGDISRREFVGPPEYFERIDADGDGLISAEEATRFDALLQKEKKEP